MTLELDRQTAEALVELLEEYRADILFTTTRGELAEEIRAKLGMKTHDEQWFGVKRQHIQD